MTEQISTGGGLKCLETVDLMNISSWCVLFLAYSAYLDGLSIKLEAILSDQELLDIFALIALKLNHLAHLTVGNDRAIASKLLLDDLENLLLIKLLGQALNCGQSLTTIALLNTNVNVVLRLLGLASVVVGLREGV